MIERTNEKETYLCHIILPCQLVPDDMAKKRIHCTAFFINCKASNAMKISPMFTKMKLLSNSYRIPNFTWVLCSFLCADIVLLSVESLFGSWHVFLLSIISKYTHTPTDGKPRHTDDLSITYSFLVHSYELVRRGSTAKLKKREKRERELAAM